MDLLVGLVGFFTESLSIVLLHAFLNSIGLVPQNENIPDWFPNTIEKTSILLLAYAALKSALNVGKKMVPTLSSTHLVRDIRKGIFKEFLFASTIKEHDIIVSDFSEMAPRAGQFILYVFSIFENALLLIFITILSLKLALYETLMSYTLLIVLIAPLLKYLKQIKSLGEQQNLHFTNVNKSLLEGLKNLFLIKLYQTHYKVLANSQVILDEHEEIHTKQAITTSSLASFPTFAGIVVVTFTALISTKYLSTPPVYLVGFLYLLIRSSQIASNLKTAISHTSYYQSSFEQMLPYLIDTQKDEGKSGSLYSTPPNTLNFEISNLNFYYDPNIQLINNLSVSMSKGSLLLIKGPSGSGKSTLLKLCLGFETPKSGSILINSTKPKEFINFHADIFGYVGPEPYLISGTIKENLLYGNNFSVTNDEIWKALEEVGLYNEIRKLEYGIETQIGYTAFLSTGQRQRISFARALLRNPQILILDEATANIDQETEKLIIAKIASLKSSIITLVVSHKDNFDSIADKTINF